MRIYVKSRGVSQDYCWLDAEKGIEIDKPPELPKFKVDMDDFSLILQRQGNKLALLVTGLRSSKRVDYQNRKIRNSVLWVADDESCLRGLVIQGLGEGENPLGSQLATQLDEMISSATTEPGFQVDFAKIKNLAMAIQAKLPDLEPSNLPNPQGKIGHLSTLKASLKNELMQSSFPEGDGLFLVIVSPTLSQSNLENDNIWRGLSNQINSGDKWMYLADLHLKKKQKSLGKNSRSGFQSILLRPFEFVQPVLAKVVFFWLGWVVSLALLGTLLIFYQNNQILTIKNNELQQKNETLTVENQKLHEENSELKVQDENSESDAPTAPVIEVPE